MKTLVATVTLMMLAASAPAQTVEVRDYRITVDGKPAGAYSMTLMRMPDGSVEQSGNASVTVRIFLRTFTYTYRGKETWKDGKLMHLESQTNDDGKGYQVAADAVPGGLRVVVNGHETLGPADVWTMTYWQLPPIARRDGEIVLLDADTGKTQKARLKSAGPATAYVGGAPMAVTRYQVSGTTRADLWYDVSDRLVRQETIEEGHRTAIELVRVRK